MNRLKSVHAGRRDSAIKERVSPLFYFCAFGLATSLLLGGAARVGSLSEALLEFLAIPVLLAALWRLIETPLSREMRQALALAAAIVALPLLQLIPLPPTIWTHAPGREHVAEAFEALGRDLPWAPFSMVPRATWLGALSLIPPLAVFLCAVQLNHRERRWISLVVLAVGLASVFIGLAQLAQGTSSPLRFYRFTTVTEAVGFFANRNQFAALLYSLVPLAAAWTAAGGAPMGDGRGRGKTDAMAISARVMTFAFLVALIATQAMTRSRAGVTLTIVALLGALAMAQWSRRETSGLTAKRVMLGAAALAIVFSMQYALYRFMERLEIDPLADARITFARNTVKAATTLMPFGAGLGSFIPVYALFEKPEDLIANTYANHAHNDYLELWLDAGVAGLMLVVAFAFWFVARAATVWRRSYAEGLEIDRSLARAATLIIALLAAHSLVDYPLRTDAMAAVFAYACALLIAPPSDSVSG